MRLQRDWTTPLTMGAFGLVAVTGLLMFFHLDSGLNKTAHEWLSWVLVAGVAAHAAVNAAGLQRHLAGWRGRSVLGAAALLLAASFVPLGPAGDGPPFLGAMRALADAPVPVLAQVAGTTPEAMRDRLRAAGHAPASDADTARTLAGSDLGEQMRLLSRVLRPAGG
ncbi:DUF4405 domain-containing protein [Piscinibacter sakaiensis]|uniref:Uncharacterized protein n=1 Tax=Piscinibacter sakaiensis TaxID=1547922 RepID=A0A0K8P283_PISS1|nr:DUF4405 domain-containing protein [Piscinibacter sakaiensis]GAP36787.1 hypothetical protein ISF6_2627 [Piscinibacter sakaiensis]